MLPTHTDVLIVGAGPTGLALANSLQKAGVNHLLIDALEQGLNTSRAAVIHAHTLEMLDVVNVGQQLSAEGIEMANFNARDRDQLLLNINFSQLPSAFKHMLMVPQPTTESLLESKLNDMGSTVHRSVSALNITTVEGGAVIRVKTRFGEQDISARYVVGADGMHSVVREAAGIGFQGASYGESFVLADVMMDWPLGRDEVSLLFSPAGLVVVAPLPGGSFRIVATLENAPEKMEIADIQAMLDERGPTKAASKVTKIIWSSRFRVHHRLADTYRKGPFLLMGDAAHVHSPAGGQGMNTGLVDAIVLGEALTRVVRDNAPDSLLNDYARIRRPAAKKVLGLASRLTRMATVRSVPGRFVRNRLLRFLNHVPPFKRNLTLALSGLARKNYTILPKAETSHQVETDGRPATFNTMAA